MTTNTGGLLDAMRAELEPQLAEIRGRLAALEQHADEIARTCDEFLGTALARAEAPQPPEPAERCGECHDCGGIGHFTVGEYEYQCRACVGRKPQPAASLRERYAKMADDPQFKAVYEGKCLSDIWEEYPDPVTGEPIYRKRKHQPAADAAIRTCAKCSYPVVRRNACPRCGLPTVDEPWAAQPAAAPIESHDPVTDELDGYDLRWIRSGNEWQLRTSDLASVWDNGTWHTWDAHGIGGENASETSVEQAKRAAEEAFVRQERRPIKGWAVRGFLDEEPRPAAETRGE